MAILDDIASYIVTNAPDAGPINGTEYLILHPVQTPFRLRVDETDRFEFAVNFIVEKGLSA